ncbi:GNAT family N-acetyltransferase [Celerinatantimonas sp. YJH-8]|uniref:GNAT family N-acetyltransferase n=1 Tax=Celerinatantimonas sp. YJH-8 TaxID=3228714 RepID=UPI0038C45979
MNIEIVIADYQNPQHEHDIVMLLDAYAQDRMGGGEPLADFVKANLVPQLAQRDDAFSLLCYVNGEPAGLANCFEGFSTFACQPLLNIHDFTVHPKFRGHGLSQRLLNRIESLAREKGCCKMTLEVLAENFVAQKAYSKYGFAPYQLNLQTGCALFWQKKLNNHF